MTPTSSGGDTPEATGDAPETIEEGTLTICSDVPYEPFEFEGGDGPSGYTGFDIDLMSAIAEANDLEIAVSDVDFDGILGNLEAGTCDVVASAVTITDERAEQVDFTDPYFDAEQSLLVKTDATSPASTTSTARPSASSPAPPARPTPTTTPRPGPRSRASTGPTPSSPPSSRATSTPSSRTSR